MFERFTDRARRVMVLAQEEARLLNHGVIGTEHILLGIIHEGGGVGAQALASLGVSLDAVRVTVEETIGIAQDPPIGRIPFSPRAKKVLEFSLREALDHHHDYIGTEHLLLALLREGEGVAAQILTKMGVDPSRLRRHVIAFWQSEGAGMVAEPTPSGETEMPYEIGDPHCPRCRARLIESASYRILEVAERGGEGHRRVLFLVLSALRGHDRQRDPSGGRVLSILIPHVDHVYLCSRNVELPHEAHMLEGCPTQVSLVRYEFHSVRPRDRLGQE